VSGDGSQATGRMAVTELLRALVAGAGATRHAAVPELSYARSRGHRACGGPGAAVGPGGRSWSHKACDGPRTVMCQETGAGATRHVAAPKLPCARTREPRDTWACAPVLPFIFDLKLIRRVPGLQSTNKTNPLKPAPDWFSRQDAATGAVMALARVRVGRAATGYIWGPGVMRHVETLSPLPWRRWSGGGRELDGLASSGGGRRRSQRVAVRWKTLRGGR
jgi:hypothetical protein